jgi:hypothetical protein
MKPDSPVSLTDAANKLNDEFRVLPLYVGPIDTCARTCINLISELYEAAEQFGESDWKKWNSQSADISRAVAKYADAMRQAQIAITEIVGAVNNVRGFYFEARARDSIKSGRTRSPLS